MLRMNTVTILKRFDMKETFEEISELVKMAIIVIAGLLIVSVVNYFTGI